eukprot:scaffold181352_cov31-Tisochrysis_lutea.AAC.5
MGMHSRFAPSILPTRGIARIRSPNGSSCTLIAPALPGAARPLALRPCRFSTSAKPSAACSGSAECVRASRRRTASSGSIRCARLCGMSVEKEDALACDSSEAALRWRSSAAAWAPRVWSPKQHPASNTCSSAGSSSWAVPRRMSAS